MVYNKQEGAVYSPGNWEDLYHGAISAKHIVIVLSSHGGRQKGKGGGMRGEPYWPFSDDISPGAFLPTLHLNVPSINTIIVTNKISALKKIREEKHSNHC